MMGATRQTEITVRAASQPAILSRLMATTACCGSEVLAACSYSDGAATVVKLVTQDARRTANALRAAGFECKSNPVILVETPNKPGLTATLGAKLTGAGINILYSYSLQSESHQTCLVFKTTDDDRAIYVLEVDALIHDLAAAKSWRPPSEALAGGFRAEPEAA
jgi:hypothetical protein